MLSLIEKSNKIALEFSFEYVDLREHSFGREHWVYDKIEHGWFVLIIWMITAMRERFFDSEYYKLRNDYGYEKRFSDSEL